MTELSKSNEDLFDFVQFRYCLESDPIAEILADRGRENAIYVINRGDRHI